MPGGASTTAKPRRRATQAERTHATTAQLVAAARDLFAERGYADTSIEGIAAAAGVTRGALYHHFAGKIELFAVVVEGEQRRLAELGFAAATRVRGGPWKQLEAGSLSFLDTCVDPGIQRIVLIDGPAALGWERYRATEEPTLAMMRAGVTEAIRQKEIARRPIDPLVTMLFGGLCEAAVAIARSSDQPASLRATRREVQRMFAALARTP